MKKVLIGLISVISIFGLLSCESNALDPMNGDSSDNSLARRHGGRSNPACPAEGAFAGFNEVNSNYGVYNYTLWADKDINVGTVSITNDDENIYVTYTTDETVELEKVRVFVWTSLDDISNKRPAPGHADYSANHIDAFTYTAVIPAAALCDDIYYITANAKVKYIDEDDDDEDDDEDENDGDDEDENDDEDDDDDRHGHDHHRAMEAYAGDAASPACFDDAGKKWWSYVGYSVDCSASISGSVYEDVNSSESFDTGDTGFEGISVTASGSDGNVYTVITAADGSYLFEHLQTGLDYTVISDTPTGDFAANENATGYILANLVTDESQINFGFAQMFDCGISSTLWVNENTSVGTMTISNDNDSLYITFDTDDQVNLAGMAVNLGPIASANILSPAEYNAYSATFSLTQDAITVAIAFDATLFVPSDNILVTAYAVVALEQSGDISLDGAIVFGGETYHAGNSKTPWFYDTDYSSCSFIPGDV
ncbi:MAG: hypothetical protein HQ506_11125 [Candidatus Marinimicrobia bacterium]|nr:hypothetical protein [Candidatus Neomarinimicrobiota bacterium]